MQRCLWWTLLTGLVCASGEYLMGGHLDNNARAKPRSGMIESSLASGRETHLDGLDLDLIAEESTVDAGAVAVAAASSALTDDDPPPSYHIPYPFAFNGGKPFSLEKDPITGKIDFEKAPPVRILNYTDRYQEGETEGSEIDSEEIVDEKDARLEREKIKGKDNEDVGPNEINTYTSNFHDFFNLPVHYSSDKYGNDKYPLISSSYANTKVQSGANSYSTYNHRPYHPENDLYPTRYPYASMTKTSTHKTTTVNGFKTRWISTTSPSTITIATLPTTTNPPKIMFSTTIKAPIITTWKPSVTPITLRTDDRMVAKAESEKKNVPPTKELQAGDMEAYDKNPNNVPAQSPSNKTTEKSQVVIHYGDQSNLNNFVLSQDTNLPLAQDEEYRDSYDIYESPDGESEDETDKENRGDNVEGDSEESDYFLPYSDLSNGHVTLMESAITSSATASTAATITNTIVASSSPSSSLSSSSTSSSSSLSGITSAATTRPLIKPSETVSFTPLTLQEDVSASNPPHRYPMTPQHPVASSQVKNDRGQNVAGYYNGIVSHEYRPSLTMTSEQDKMGSGIVIEGTSNIVIPPGQDTVSFVLGNHQNVDGSYYSVGTAIGESPYGTLSDIDASFWPFHDNPHSPMKEIKHEYPSISIAELNPDHVMQKWPSTSSTKNNHENLEPAKAESQGSFAAASIAVVDGDTKNRSEEKYFNHVTFPHAEAKDKDAKGEETTGEHAVNETDSNIRELATDTVTTTIGTVTTRNQTMVDLFTANVGGDLPELAENLMPPAESSRPPTSYYYQYQHDTERLRPGHPRPQRLPLPVRSKPHSGPSASPLDTGLRRRPYPPDTKLPNILPQFRPNAKASHGHRFSSDVIGTMLAGQNSPGTRIRQPLQNHQSSRRPFPPPSPSYLQRLNPPPPPIHAVRLALVPTSKVDSLALPHETEPTIRRFRPPHIGLEENGPASSKRLFGRGTRGQHESEGDGGEADGNESEKQDRNKNKIVGERENEDTERYPEEPPMTPPRPPLFPKRRTADPPRVTTLQMIQHHGEFSEDEDHSLAQSMEPVLAHRVSAERRKSDSHDPSEVGEQPVYVVYPVNSAVNIHSDDPKEKDGSVVVGTRGPHRPLPPDTLLQNERQKVHTAYNPLKSVALDFPYPLERPDPSSMFSTDGIKETPLLIPNEQRQQASFAAANERENEKKTEQDAINVIPYLQDFLPYQRKNNAAISVTLHRAVSTSTTTPISTSTSTSTSTSASTSTSTSVSPIAYVYTPTRAATHSTHHFNDEMNVDTNVDVTATILLPSQQPSSSSSSAPAPQNFMAPFVASMSAEGPTKNGWSVVVMEPSEADKRLDGDSDDTKSVNPTIDTQTDKNEFDADNFRPQLFGGFKPIYEFPMEDMEHRDIVDTNTETDIGKRSEELRVT